MKFIITAALSLAVLAVVAPAAEAAESSTRLSDRIDTILMERDMGMTLKDLPKKHDIRRRTRGTDNGRKLKKGGKGGKGKGEPESCCELITQLAKLDLACFSIVNEAATYDNIRFFLGDCAADVVPKSKGKGGSSQTGGELTGLLAEYDDAVTEYDELLDLYLDGDIEGLGPECFTDFSEPETFTFACEEFITVTFDDDNAFFDYITDDTDIQDFYNVDDLSF